MPIPSYPHPIPLLTTEQMIEVDRLMIEEYGIELIQMMENAGRCLALLAKEWLDEEVQNKRIVILAGTGGNGGGAMVCARRLHNWGAQVNVFLSRPEGLTPVPAHQAQILNQMGIPCQAGIPETSIEAELIIDGIIGYSLSGNPRGTAGDMIRWANTHAAPTIALDTPSGVSLTKGEIFDPVIKAEATLTLALPKSGLYEESVIPLRGALYLGDISVPPHLYAEPSLEIDLGPIFAAGDVLQLTMNIEH